MDFVDGWRYCTGGVAPALIEEDKTGLWITSGSATDNVRVVPGIPEGKF